MGKHYSKNLKDPSMMNKLNMTPDGLNNKLMVTD